VQHAVLDFVMGSLSGESCLNCGHHGSEIVRMYTLAPVIEMIENLIVSIAEHFFQHGI